MKECDLERGYRDSIIPWVNQSGIRGTLPRADGVTLRYLGIEAEVESAALVFLCGYHECFLKYVELFHDLKDDGLSFYCCDMRGQGFSDHQLADPQIAWVESWEQYVDDFAAFMNDVVMARPHRKVFLLAHSQGGAIAAIYLARHHPAVQAAILNAPLVGDRFPPVAKTVVRALDLLGKGRDRIPGGKPYAPGTLEKDHVTHSPVRHEIKNALSERHPEICLGDPSNHFVVQLLSLAAAARRAAPSLSVPVLVFKAEDDFYVHPGALDDFCSRLPHGRKVLFPGARHEIFIETDAVRNRAIEEIRGFMMRAD